MMSNETILISHVASWVVLVVEAFGLLAIARLVGQMSLRFPPAGARVVDAGPELGARIREWTSKDLLTGRSVSFRLESRGVLLVFLSPHCGVCTRMIPAAKHFFAEVEREVAVVWVMTVGSEGVQEDYARKHGLGDRPVVAEEQLPAALRLEGAPFGLWVGKGGRVLAKGMVNHREHLESLRNEARRSSN